MLGLSANAQVHIKFKGIEVAGNVKEFVAKYKAKYPSIKELPGGINGELVFKDSFCGMNGQVVIYYTNANIVYKVAFASENMESWRVLEYNYQAVFDQIKNKYGAPNTNKRVFEYPFDKEDILRGKEDIAVKSDKCNYLAYWSLFEGEIMMSILKNMSVAIWYTDSSGSVKFKAEQNAEYQNEV